MLKQDKEPINLAAMVNLLQLTEPRPNCGTGNVTIPVGKCTPIDFVSNRRIRVSEYEAIFHKLLLIKYISCVINQFKL